MKRLCLLFAGVAVLATCADPAQAQMCTYYKTGQQMGELPSSGDCDNVNWLMDVHVNKAKTFNNPKSLKCPVFLNRGNGGISICPMTDDGYSLNSTFQVQGVEGMFRLETRTYGMGDMEMWLSRDGHYFTYRSDHPTEAAFNSEWQDSDYLSQFDASQSSAMQNAIYEIFEHAIVRKQPSIYFAGGIVIRDMVAPPMETTMCGPKCKKAICTIVAGCTASQAKGTVERAMKPRPGAGNQAGGIAAGTIMVLAAMACDAVVDAITGGDGGDDGAEGTGGGATGGTGGSGGSGGSGGGK